MKTKIKIRYRGFWKSSLYDLLGQHPPVSSIEVFMWAKLFNHDLGLLVITAS